MFDLISKCYIGNDYLSIFAVVLRRYKKKKENENPRSTFLSNSTNVKHLATGLDVGIITTNHLSLAREIRFWQVVKIQILQHSKS